MSNQTKFELAIQSTLSNWYLSIDIYIQNCDIVWFSMPKRFLPIWFDIYLHFNGELSFYLLIFQNNKDLHDQFDPKNTKVHIRNKTTPFKSLICRLAKLRCLHILLYHKSVTLHVINRLIYLYASLLLTYKAYPSPVLLFYI